MQLVEAEHGHASMRCIPVRPASVAIPDYGVPRRHHMSVSRDMKFRQARNVASPGPWWLARLVDCATPTCQYGFFILFP